MDIGIIAGVGLLVVWAVAALVFDGPGWVQFLLTLGVFLIIYRIVVRGDKRRPTPPAS